ncbi:MAG TPA: host-nuclease inhibitor Gam family protein [Candidatus Binatia bacterium]|nr:host-nuclease inhibitor Gam family protein [Candidatus Binatia bacterium]
MKAKAEQPSKEDFANMVNLLSVYSDASNRLTELETSANFSLLSIVDEHRAEYAQLQKALMEAETALEAIALAHPQWFGEDRKSIKTPYGTVKFHSGIKLVVKNEEATVLLIQREGEHNPEFKADDYLRKVETLNIEALERFDDSTLKKFRIERVREDKFSVVPAKVDMGKAVKEAAEKEAA